MIYLDNNATTPIDPRVVEAMCSIYSMGPLNPSAIHRYGKKGKELILRSRDFIADYFGVLSSEIYFTSSSTESLTTLILGHIAAKKINCILSTKIEHNAVDSILKKIALQGVKVDYIPVDEKGFPTFENLQESVTEKTQLVILSSVYSETGMMPDLEAIAQFLYAKKIPLIVDATAHVGKAPFIVHPGISGFSLSAHKFHGPQGVGLMFARKNFPVAPVFVGGHQEMHLRAGTENVAGIVGMKKAIELIDSDSFIFQEMLSSRLLTELIPHGNLNGTGQRISNTCNFSFENYDAETLLIRLDQRGVLCSMGSACSSGSIEPSRVLLEMGLDKNRARSSLRFSVSRMNSIDQIDLAVQIIKEELCECAL